METIIDRNKLSLKAIAQINYELEKIENNSTLAVDDDLVDNYEFQLLQLSLKTNELEDINEKANLAVDKIKAKRAEEIIKEYDENPLKNAKWEVKPMADNAIERQLWIEFIDFNLEYKTNKSKITKMQKDIRAYERRGNRMADKLKKESINDARNKKQWLI